VGAIGQRADAMRTPLTDLRAAITQPQQLTAPVTDVATPADAPNQVWDASTWLVESITPLGHTDDGQPLVLISLLIPTAHLAEHTPASTRAGPYAAPKPSSPRLRSPRTHTRVFYIGQPPLGLAPVLVQADPNDPTSIKWVDTYDLHYLGWDRAVNQGEALPKLFSDAPVADQPLSSLQGESLRMLMGDGMANAINGAIEITPLVLGTAGNVAEGTVGGLLISAPEATGLTKVGGGLLIADALDRQQALFRCEPTMFEQLCATYMTEDEVRRANMIKNGGMMVIMLGSAVPGANEPVGQLAAKGYLRVTKGTQWRSCYDSFTPGSARLRLNLGRRQLLYRAHNEVAYIQGGEFAATSPGRTPVEVITKNALHPRITGNRARFQYQVTPRPRFYLYVEGEVASQGGAFVGGNTQVLILERPGGTFVLDRPVPYGGTP
jgi:hypothetical protein